MERVPGILRTAALTAGLVAIPVEARGVAHHEPGYSELVTCESDDILGRTLRIDRARKRGMSDLTVYVNGYKSQTRSIRHQGSETVIDFKMANEKGEHLLKANFDRYRLDEKPLVKCKSPHQTLQEIKS